MTIPRPRFELSLILPDRLLRFGLSLAGLVLWLVLAAAEPAAAVEAVRVPVDATVLDLTNVVERNRSDGDVIQISTAPGPDGIVRRIEVEANDERSSGDWAVFALANTTDQQLDRLIVAEPVPAAVLAGLIERPEGTSVLLTVRSGQLRNHPGQIAFPGGCLDPRDASPEAAALREANEEIGLTPADAQVIGFLPDHLVLTGYRVTPVVAEISPSFAWVAEATEVDGVFELPWSVLEDASSVHSIERRIGPLLLPMREIHFSGHRIWGLTAFILLLLRDLGAPA
jgi:8-oxo-dGTP pyrophosphatase MutT (NUDIX family)